eukprot:6212318-Pleurochrysis_carterae.AAC.2
MHGIIDDFTVDSRQTTKNAGSLFDNRGLPQIVHHETYEDLLVFEHSKWTIPHDIGIVVLV